MQTGRRCFQFGSHREIEFLSDYTLQQMGISGALQFSSIPREKTSHKNNFEKNSEQM